MALEMRTNCERCKKTLGPTSMAYICSYECTYCGDCALNLQFTCTNCHGELVRRPKMQGETASGCNSPLN